MKKLLSFTILILAITTLFPLSSVAKTLQFEDNYVGENEVVLASFNTTKQFIADSENPEPLEEACYWMSDFYDKYNFKYVSFIGNLSSMANYVYKEIVTNQGKTKEELFEINENDTEWRKDFELLKEIASILTEAKIPYGVSLNDYDYFSKGFSRLNHLQTVFGTADFTGEADVTTEIYDNNNYATIFMEGKTQYIVYQLEIFPRQKTLNWFNSTQAKHSDKRAIIYTTSFVDANGEMYTQHDWSEKNWSSIYQQYNSTLRTGMIWDDHPHDGINLWKEAFSKHDNILCVISANAKVGKDIVVTKFKNNNGYEITSILANLQGGYGDIGNPYPLMLKISADNLTLDVRYAVPYFNNVGGYIEESKQIIKVNKVLPLPEPDPVLLLPKIEIQYNGENTAYINGYENNLFKPNANMTKAEACTIFARLLTKKQTIPDGYITKFEDVKQGDWYYNAIAYLDQNGYLYSTQGTKYNPNEKITRAEFVELAYLCSTLSASANITFSDVDETNKYFKAIMAAAATGLVNGYEDGTFKPSATITRAEVVTVINRLLTLVADKELVSKTHSPKQFSDISGHWAEYQIILASNDNVRGDYFYNIDKTVLQQDNKNVFFENDHVKISIAKNGGTVTEIINKATGENVVAKSSSPWFTYLLNNSNVAIQPKTVSIADGRLKVNFKNNVTAYYIIDTEKDFFTVTLDTSLPKSVNGAVICQLNTNAFWELDNENAYGLSGVSMTTTVENGYYPGGSTKIAKGITYTYLDCSTIGAKFGVAFSKMTEHREHLKRIADAIDPNKGITSTHGGAYALDCPDLFSDYIILSSGLTNETAEETAALCEKYSVEQIDIHQGANSTFITADFYFTCAAKSSEKKINKFVDAKAFKERVGNTLTSRGIQLSLHTYSSLVPMQATRILSNPSYQKDLVKAAETWTVRGRLAKAKTSIKTYENASNFQTGTGDIPWNNIHTKYILIDEEIIKVQQGTSAGFLNVKRGQCGTEATPHEDGAIIYQLCGWFGMFQPKPLSNLFYHVAEATAQAYNDGGFEMIYLDGLESFAHDGLYDERQKFYIYAEFVRTVVSNCDVDPIIEFSSMQPSLWSARGRAGAIDPARRAYKQFKENHFNIRQKPFLNYFYTATAGWFHYCPDKDNQFKDTVIRTLYRDDLDHMGSLCIGYNFGTVCSPFSVAVLNEKTRLADNFMYYGLYTRLREGNYFSPEVREQLTNGEYEYKLFKQEDGSWAFKEMKYIKHKIFDISDSIFQNAKGENPFAEQTPFIRIEQRYSTKGEDGTTVFEFDETKAVSTYAGKHNISKLDIAGKMAYKIKVYGNSSATDAILISIKASTVAEAGRYDYFIPLNFSGWKEFILLETNNADYEGYEFSDIVVETTGYESFRNLVDFKSVDTLQVSLCGECNGVKLDDLIAFAPTDAPSKNPSVTIGNNTITFEAELHGGDFIEYYPDENKAYLNYYTQIYNNDDEWSDDEAHVKEIKFTGNITVPAGSFEYSYKAEALSELTTRAQLVIGLSGAVIENPESWVEPKLDIPENIEKVALY